MGGIYEVDELFDKVGKNRRRWETRKYLAILRHLWQIIQIKNSYQLLYSTKENHWNAKTYLPIVCHLWQIIQIPNWLSIENVSQDKSPIWMGGSKKLPPPIFSKLQPFLFSQKSSRLLKLLFHFDQKSSHFLEALTFLFSPKILLSSQSSNIFLLSQKSRPLDFQPFFIFTKNSPTYWNP